MRIQPGQRLVIPATIDCPFPPTLQISLGVLSDSDSVELMWFPASQLGTLVQFISTFSATESQVILGRLKAGANPSGDVPTIDVSGDEPYAASRVDTWTALQRAGVTKLPVMATKEAADWLKRHTEAETSLPEGWRVRAG